MEALAEQRKGSTARVSTSPASRFPPNRTQKQAATATSTGGKSLAGRSTISSVTLDASARAAAAAATPVDRLDPEDTNRSTPSALLRAGAAVTTSDVGPAATATAAGPAVQFNQAEGSNQASAASVASAFFEGYLTTTQPYVTGETTLDTPGFTSLSDMLSFQAWNGNHPGSVVWMMKVLLAFFGQNHVLR